MQTTLAIVEWIEVLKASIEAARAKAIAALTAPKVKKADKPEIQATPEMLLYDAKYRLNKQRADRAETAKDKWRDALIAAASTETGRREVVINNRDKKMGTIMNVPKSTVDWERLALDFPDIALMIKTNYTKPPVDGWQYRAH